MKRVCFNIPKIGVAMAVTLFCLFAFSCIRDGDIHNDQTENGTKVTLSLKLPAGTTAGTRALKDTDENYVKTVEILVFKGGYYSYTAFPTAITRNGDKVTCAVDLVKSNDADNDDIYDLVVLANSRDAVVKQNFTEEHSKAKVLEALTETVSDKWNTDSGSEYYKPIPMSSNPDLHKGLTINNSLDAISVDLHRALAKVNIMLSVKDSVQASSTFELRNVYVYNYNEKGAIVPYGASWGEHTEAEHKQNGKKRVLTPTIPSEYTHPAGNYLYYDGSAVKNTGCINEIYLFETENHTDNSEDGEHKTVNGLADRTCIVVGGAWAADGNFTGVDTSYYRIDFVVGSGASAEWLDVLRNHTYKFSIVSIGGAGYGSPEEAFASDPINIESELTWDNDDDEITDIVFNDHNYLGVGPGEFSFYKEGSTGNELFVSTDIGDGNWDFVVDSEYADWITVTETIKLADGKYKVIFSVDKNNYGEVRTGYITINAESLTCNVKIIQGIQYGLPDIPTEPIVNTVLPEHVYVGAFWRANQKGERLITMSLTAGYKYAVQVLNRGDFSEDDILFMEGHPETIDERDPDTIGALVTGDRTFLIGTVPDDGELKFRIGLKTKWSENASYATKKVRYARVLVSFGNGNYNSHRILWLRQGEETDYLMAPGDPTTAEGAANSNSNRRIDRVRKFSPYNLTSNYLNDAGTYQYQIEPGAGDLTEYPTQAGALFQYAQNNSTKNRAYHPTSITMPKSEWDGQYTWGTFDETYNVCPVGYTRPVGGDLGAMTNNQFAQSLLLKPTDRELKNCLFGYYADGYFDRREIDERSVSPIREDLPTEKSSVNGTKYNVAYIGYLFYNPVVESDHYTASLFFPATGYRSSETSVAHAGYSCCYWSSSLHSIYPERRGSSFGVNDTGVSADGQTNHYLARAVRCVRVD